MIGLPKIPGMINSTIFEFNQALISICHHLDDPKGQRLFMLQDSQNQRDIVVKILGPPIVPSVLGISFGGSKHPGISGPIIPLAYTETFRLGPNDAAVAKAIQELGRVTYCKVNSEDAELDMWSKYFARAATYISPTQ